MNAAPAKNITPEKQILNYIQEHGTTWTWLAGKVKCSVAHLQLVIKGKKGKKRVLTPEMLSKINKALKTNFTQQ